MTLYRLQAILLRTVKFSCKVTCCFWMVLWSNDDDDDKDNIDDDADADYYIFVPLERECHDDIIFLLIIVINL